MADLVLLKARQVQVQKKADLILATAEREGRNLTDAEKAELTAHERDIDSLAAKIEQAPGDEALLAIANGNGRPPVNGSGAPAQGASWGTTFTSNPGIVEFLKAGRPTAGQWSSPSVELSAATILESTSPIVTPQVIPGIVSGPVGPIVMSQLFAPGTATSGLIEYMRESLATNNAAAVAEGTAKPESVLAYAPVTTPLTKVATWLPASDEILNDVPQLLSTIDTRLRGFVLVRLDDELLNGSGVAPHMTGLLTRSDLTPPVAATAGKALDAIAQQIAAVELASMLPVDGIVLNGADWLALGLIKDTTGQYLSGSPFTQAGPRTLFGRRVATTPAMPQGKALVGAFGSGGGQLFMHPTMKTAISNSHQDFFIKNLVAILSEVRAALALYRPVAFGLVTGVAAP